MNRKHISTLAAVVAGCAALGLFNGLLYADMGHANKKKAHAVYNGKPRIGYEVRSYGGDRYVFRPHEPSHQYINHWHRKYFKLYFPGHGWAWKRGHHHGRGHRRLHAHQHDYTNGHARRWSHHHHRHWW